MKKGCVSGRGGWSDPALFRRLSSSKCTRNAFATTPHVFCTHLAGSGDPLIALGVDVPSQVERQLEQHVDVRVLNDLSAVRKKQERDEVHSKLSEVRPIGAEGTGKNK